MPARRETTGVMQASLRFTSAVTIPIFLLLACVPPKGDLGVYTDTEATGGTSGSGSSSGSDGSTASGGSTTDDGPTGTSTEGPEEYPAGCGEPPQPSWERAEFGFDPPLAGDNFAGDCEITDIEDHQATFNVGLDCGEQTAQIQLQLDEPLPASIAVGDTITLDYRFAFISDNNHWFTLRRPAPDSTLLLGGLTAEALSPADINFFAPLSMTRQEGLCALPVTCEDPGEKLAVELHHGDESALVFDGYSAVIGEPAPYRVSVSSARKYHGGLPSGTGEQCPVFDGPPYYFLVMMRPAA